MGFRDTLATVEESARRARELLAWTQLLSVAAGGALVVSRIHRQIWRGFRIPHFAVEVRVLVSGSEAGSCL